MPFLLNTSRGDYRDWYDMVARAGIQSQLSTCSAPEVFDGLPEWRKRHWEQPAEGRIKAMGMTQPQVRGFAILGV